MSCSRLPPDTTHEPGIRGNTASCTTRAIAGRERKQKITPVFLTRIRDSLHDKLLALPDEVLVYPAHGAGSLCAKKLSSDTVSTLGEQQLCNYALKQMTKEDFIRLVVADQPPYFTYDAILNTQERVGNKVRMKMREEDMSDAEPKLCRVIQILLDIALRAHDHSS